MVSSFKPPLALSNFEHAAVFSELLGTVCNVVGAALVAPNPKLRWLRTLKEGPPDRWTFGIGSELTFYWYPCDWVFEAPVKIDALVMP